jgi:hypothetical protein
VAPIIPDWPRSSGVVTRQICFASIRISRLRSFPESVNVTLSGRKHEKTGIYGLEASFSCAHREPPLAAFVAVADRSPVAGAMTPEEMDHRIAVSKAHALRLSRLWSRRTAGRHIDHDLDRGRPAYRLGDRLPDKAGTIGTLAAEWKAFAQGLKAKGN